ncbi:MAG: hypothetical protein B7Z44_10530 [Caulobacter sp. 12-67-6]|nr:MAG: hypothetical protein B7Z44_10530 [Caulobacter sp. 12-67-6]OYX71324.1 MAG: hypothetical protein B7Y81_09675 [Caulobacter sp. 32-67-35]
MLVLSGCAPGPADQAQICAVLAQPSAPGLDQIGDAAALTALDKRLQGAGRIYGPEWLGGPIRYWGRCPRRPDTVQILLMDPEHRFAATKGGPRDHGVQRRYGTCFYERGETGWRLLACRINDAS